MNRARWPDSLANGIAMRQGSSIAPEIIAQVRARATGQRVVFDTVIEDRSAERFPDRPWGPGNNPKTAVWDYLKTHPEFEIDRSIPHKLLITVAPDGYLRRVK